MLPIDTPASAAVPLASSSPTPTPAPTSLPADCNIIVTENGKELECNPLKSWRTANGRQAYQVQVVASGEMLTLVEVAPASGSEGGPGQEMTTHIFHWGKNGTPPPGTPMPPETAVAQGVPPAVTTQPLNVSQAVGDHYDTGAGFHSFVPDCGNSHARSSISTPTGLSPQPRR